MTSVDAPVFTLDVTGKTYSSALEYGEALSGEVYEGHDVSALDGDAHEFLLRVMPDGSLDRETKLGLVARVAEGMVSAVADNAPGGTLNPEEQSLTIKYSTLYASALMGLAEIAENK